MVAAETHLRVARGRAAAGRGLDDLEQLYREHFGFVWRAVRRMGVDEEVAEDLVQETFIVVHRRFTEYDGRSSPRRWLYILTRGVVANYRRRTERAGRRHGLMSPPSSRPPPDEVVAQGQAAVAVGRFLTELDPDKRAVFELTDIEGMSAPDIAVALGVKLNTVYSRLRAARHKFREFARQQQPGRGLGKGHP